LFRHLIHLTAATGVAVVLIEIPLARTILQNCHSTTSLKTGAFRLPQEISVLISQLSHTEAAQRRAAAEALSRLGEEARPAAIPLARAAGDENEEVQEWAVAAMEELGPPSENDLNAVAELLADENADVAYWAATLIGRLGEQGLPATTALCAALGQHRPLNVRERAAWALGRIGPSVGPQAVETLKQAAAESQPRLARVAQRALEQASQ
jgi:HEAT repeat protein